MPRAGSGGVSGLSSIHIEKRSGCRGRYEASPKSDLSELGHGTVKPILQYYWSNRGCVSLIVWGLVFNVKYKTEKMKKV